MATSGDTTWQLQRDSIIKAALRKVNALFEGQTPTTEQINTGAEALNALVTSWRADGMPVWAMKKFTFSTVAGQQDYTIGVGQSLNTPMPLKVTEAVRINNISGNRVPLNIYTDYDFKLLPNPSQGTPVQIYYQPLSTYGTLRLWPIPDTNFATNSTIEITYQRPFEDFDNATDEPDFPSYWTRALIYGLAVDLAPENGLPLRDRTELRAEAKEIKDLALSFGTEEGSIRFMPDWVLMMDNSNNNGGDY